MDERFNGLVKPNENNPDIIEAFLPVIHANDSHASNLMPLDNGDLLCVWFNGPGEGQPDTNVLLSRLNAGSSQWSEPLQLSNDPERSEQNPVIFQAPDGKVWLFHTSNEPHNQKTSRVMIRISEDRGYTWGEPTVLFDDVGLFLRQPPVVLKNGDWVLPAYYCKSEGHYSVVKISTDQGQSWTEYPVPDSLHSVQMSIVQRDDDSLFAVFRSRSAVRIYTSVSHDNGRTWSVPAKSYMPNNNSSIQMTKLPNGHLALVYNDSSLERDQFRWIEKKGQFRRKTLRTPLTLAISEDGGLTWPHYRNVQTADLEYKDSLVGYSYPSVTSTQDGKIHVSFSYLRKCIKYVCLDEAWVKEDI